MPTMPIIKDNSSDEGKNISPQETGGLVPSESLGIKETEAPELDEKQEYVTPESELKSIVDVPKISRKGIAVTATRPGFYGQRRLKIGDKFVVQKLEHLGLWMKCDDPDTEKKRIEFLKLKKAK